MAASSALPRTSDPKYSIIVVELDDTVERRHPKKPNLYVGLTTMSIADRYELLVKRPSLVGRRGNVRQLRTDLSTPLTTSDHAVAKEAMTTVVSLLRSQGFTVNGTSPVWTVYVIELDNTGVPGAEKGYFYVGETSKDPALRFEEHRANKIGGRNGRTKLASRVVTSRGMRLRMDLAPKDQCYSKSASKAAEAAWAERLRKRGYKVAGGH